ncbi:MAG: GWxTD domain-containing protein, partial [Terriglobales bacterium]
MLSMRLRSLFVLFLLGLLVLNGAAAPQNTGSQEEDPLQRQKTEKQKKEQEKKLKKELGQNYKNWLEQDVRWIILEEEMQAFKQFSNDEERENFIEQFWIRRDPTPDTLENEYREEHY